MVVLVVGVALAATALVGLAVQATRGNGVVGVQRDAATIHGAALDNAFYHCVDVQVRSLVAPGDPVLLGGNLSDLITLMKSSGSWITVADPPSSATATVKLRDDVTGPGACLGTVVVATYLHPHDGIVLRTGTGASLPGSGPPPAPPL